MCSIILISTLIYPVIILDFFQLVVTNSPSLPGTVVGAKNDLIAYLVFIQVVITFLVFILFIFFTHKIAGPLYKLKNHLAEIRAGRPISPLTFRDGDYFQDVAEEVSLFLESVAQNQETDFQYVEEIASYLENLAPVVPDDKKPILNEISRRLLAIQSRYKNSH